MESWVSRAHFARTASSDVESWSSCGSALSNVARKAPSSGVLITSRLHSASIPTARTASMSAARSRAKSSAISMSAAPSSNASFFPLTETQTEMIPPVAAVRTTPSRCLRRSTRSGTAPASMASSFASSGHVSSVSTARYPWRSGALASGLSSSAACFAMFATMTFTPFARSASCSPTPLRRQNLREWRDCASTPFPAESQIATSFVTAPAATSASTPSGYCPMSWRVECAFRRAAADGSSIASRIAGTTPHAMPRWIPW
mmetsp:Transcript_60805/g.144732  ORF Transcript_60805/g.144732 Transcript_60805/m.144732 type:complete len:260 (+) Transcript_60805:350-1129(+)